MSFLPFAILAYVFNGFSTIIDKILLKTGLPNPVVYVFYINILGLLALFLLPFGIIFDLEAASFSVLSGILFSFALLTYFQSLKMGEASVVAPMVGSLNPLFTLIIGYFLLGQVLADTQLLAFFVILLGAFFLTSSLWLSKLHFNKQLTFMILSGFFFGLSNIALKEGFNASNFVSGLVFNRLGGGLLVLIFLLDISTRSQIFASKLTRNNFMNKTSLLVFTGQTMGALSGLLITFGIFLANPALVNALFGVQYLVILGAALILSKDHPGLLEERLTKKTLAQKILGAVILSIGVFLLAL